MGAEKRRSTSADGLLGLDARRHNCYDIAGVSPMNTLKGSKRSWTYRIEADSGPVMIEDRCAGMINVAP
jgi:hypothetical protein